MISATTVAIAYHSGQGHTAVLAEAVGGGATEAGATAVQIPVDTVTAEQWRTLDAADAIVFGAPTYLGTASAAFHVFAESTSGRWAKRAWTGKVAAGFTVSGSMSGDKLHTLQYFSIFAAQHGMHWVNLDLLPGWSASTASVHDLNRLGITLGAGAQTDTDRGPEAVSGADARTAFHLGARVARVAAALNATPALSAAAH
ncbi:flavodoxin family protein [Streptomyces sp. NPDC047706]|uniref:flavodoxin family protein n=1 Tax=Streptomyces sp. NPDC047706 TaxID=3365486 RepID=UPI00371BCCA7